jgi:hypothetical protein
MDQDSIVNKFSIVQCLEDLLRCLYEDAKKVLGGQCGESAQLTLTETISEHANGMVTKDFPNGLR